jgi:DNA-binding MarR family transcriptional regulator
MTDTLQLIQIVRQSMDVLIHRAWRDQGHFVKSTGLSMPQFGILMQLYYQRQCGLSDISNRMEITGAAASQLVDKLVQSGLIARAEDPNDRRAKQLTLSEKGRELIETGLAARHHWVEALVEYLEPAEIEKVAEGLTVLTGAVQQMKKQEKSITE